MNTQAVCNFTPVEPPVHTPTDPDYSASREVKTQWELLRKMGNLTEMDLEAMGAGVIQYQALLETVDRNVFELIAAKNLMIDPKSGTRYQQWLARHFPSLASKKQAPKQVRDQLRRAQMAGVAVPDILPFYTTDQTDAFAKFYGVKALENMVKEVNTTLNRAGVRMSKRKRGQLIQHLIEVGQRERNINTATMGSNAIKRAEKQAEKARQRVMDLGLSEEGVDELLRIVDQGRTAFDELYVLANAYGVPTEALENMGYFPRVFSDDAKFVVRHADKDVVSRWAANPSLGLEAAFQKSRNTDEFIVEDELIMAHVLGLLDDGTKSTADSAKKTVKRGLRRDTVVGNATTASKQSSLAKRARTQATDAVTVLQTKYDELLEQGKQRKRVERVVRGLDNRIKRTAEELDKLSPDSLEGQMFAPTKVEERLQQLPQLLESLKNQKQEQLDLIATIDQNLAAKPSIEEQLQEARKLADRVGAEYEGKKAARQKAINAVKKLPSKDEVAAAQAQLDEVLNQAREALNPVMMDENVLKRELAQLPDATLDTLVDSGVLSKLPMHSEQFYDFFIQKYKTPYKGVEELLVTDPIRAYEHAANQLKQQIGNSMMTQTMYRDAVQNGWGVTSSMRSSNPTEYGSYVQLDKNVLKKFGVTESIPGADDIYLHPMVVDQYLAILEVTTDPFTMGSFAATWQYMFKLFKNQVLGTTGMLGRQVYQLFTSSVMGGTNLANIIPDTYKYIQFQKVGYEVYDNTKKIFANGTMTEREMIVKLVERGEIGSNIAANIAGTGGFKSNETFSALNPANTARALGYWKSIIDGNGVFPKMVDGKVEWQAVEYGTNLIYKFSAEQSGRLMSAAVFMENAFKIAHYRSTLRDGAMNAVGQFATNGKRYHFMTVEDAIDHAHNYFFDYSDVGVGDKLFRQNLIPFWVYQSRNVPAQVRNAMRNPAQFMAYQRLYALMNQEARNAKEDAPEGGFAPWMQGFGQVYFKHPTKADTWFNIPFTSFDPIADASKTLVGLNNSIERSLGYYPGNFRDKLKQSDPKNHTLPFIDLLMEQSGGPMKAILGTISGKDSLGRSLQSKPGKTTSLLGVEIPGKHAPLVKFLVENSLPSVSQLNQLNPGEIFGLREQKDAKGNVTRQAKQSIFGVDRSDSDADVDESRGEFGWVSALRASGLTVNTVNVARGMQFTETELSFAAKDMKEYAKSLNSALKNTQVGTEKHTELYKQYITALAMAKEIEEGRQSSEDWLGKRGLKPQFEKKRGKGRGNRKKDFSTANRALEQLR
jgi:hypothetical protein